MATKLYLLENIDGLGKIGEIASVSDGYARNYLIPKGKAVSAKSGENAGLLRQIERRKVQAKEEYDRGIAESETRAEELNKVSITIPMQVNDEGKLFGSVTNQQIVNSLKELNINIDRRSIVLNSGIRELGTHSVEIHLHTEVIATLSVTVVKMEV